MFYQPHMYMSLPDARQNYFPPPGVQQLSQATVLNQGFVAIKPLAVTVPTPSHWQPQQVPAHVPNHINHQALPPVPVTSHVYQPSLSPVTVNQPSLSPVPVYQQSLSPVSVHTAQPSVSPNW